MKSEKGKEIQRRAGAQEQGESERPGTWDRMLVWPGRKELGGCIKEAPRLHSRIRHPDYDTIVLGFPLEIYFENDLILINIFYLCLQLVLHN